MENSDPTRWRTVVQSSGLDGALATLFPSVAAVRKYDPRLQRTLLHALGVTRGLGHVSKIASRGTTLAFFQPRYDAPELMRSAINAAERAIESRAPRFDPSRRFQLDNSLAGVAIRLRDLRSQSQYDWAAFFYDRSRVWSKKRLRTEDEEDSFAHHHSKSTLPVVHSLLCQREQLFSIFPKELSERFWSDARRQLLCEKSQSDEWVYLVPPWDRGPERTVSLCFDLRKSTFCMEQADDSERYATWIHDLFEILRRVTHRHGGVFADTTGDGALVHFLSNSCLEVYNRDPILAAIECAVDMQTATDVHLERLRKFLRLDSELLGAGIGIDLGDVHWSVDHRGTPVTVGRGVVGACRLCDNASKGRIQLTNVIYQSLEDRDLRRLPTVKRVLLRSKEFSKARRVMVWELQAIAGALRWGQVGSSRSEICLLCEEVYDESERLRSIREEDATSRV